MSDKLENSKNTGNVIAETSPVHCNGWLLPMTAAIGVSGGLIIENSSALTGDVVAVGVNGSVITLDATPDESSRSGPYVPRTPGPRP